MQDTGSGERFRAITRSTIDKRPEWQALDPELREAIETVSLVLPFRTNAYLMEQLIDWSRVPDDPIFQLTFPQRRDGRQQRGASGRKEAHDDGRQGHFFPSAFRTRSSRLPSGLTFTTGASLTAL